MAKQPGSAHGIQNECKTKTEKFRVTADFIAAIEQAKKASPFWFKGKNNSKIYRWMILEGLVRHVSDQVVKNQIQDEIRKELWSYDPES